MGQTYAMFAWLGVHDVHSKVVDNVEPACECNAAIQLGRFHWRATNVFDLRMLKPSAERKPDLGMWSALHNGQRKLINIDWDVVLGD